MAHMFNITQNMMEDRKGAASGSPNGSNQDLTSVDRSLPRRSRTSIGLDGSSETIPEMRAPMVPSIVPPLGDAEARAMVFQAQVEQDNFSGSDSSRTLFPLLRPLSSSSDAHDKPNSHSKVTIANEPFNWRVFWSQLIILPTNPYKNGWDIYVLFILISIIFALPLQICFEVGSDYGPYDAMVDITFIIDMILTFFTAVENKNRRLITNHKEIASRYFRFWFWIDVLSIFPFQWVLPSTGESKLTRLLRFPRLIRLLRVLRLQRLLKSPRFQSILLAIEYSPRIHPSVFRVGRVVIFLIVFTHMWYCFLPFCVIAHFFLLFLLFLIFLLVRVFGSWLATLKMMRMPGQSDYLTQQRTL